MKPRNLYRIIIGVSLILSGIVSILLTAGEVDYWDNVTGSRICVPDHRGSPVTGNMAMTGI